jgi:hypothetical protein
MDKTQKSLSRTVGSVFKETRHRMNKTLEVIRNSPVMSGI